MVNDDFSALDFLSVGSFQLTSTPAESHRPAKKKRFAIGGRKVAPARRRLSEILPLLGRKLTQPKGPKAAAKMSGWPMPLSWPRSEPRALPNWDEASEQLHS